MRLLLLVLLVYAPSAWSQETGAAYGVETGWTPPSAVEMSDTATASMLPVDTRVLAPVEGDIAAAQPTVRGFLYQVFLTAVTALVTALVWRAVF